MEFIPIVPGEVRMYTCGPTVYNYAHIGNYRAYIFEDLLRRFLKWRGFRVTQIMNVTDVDDKIIKASNERGVSIDEYTAPFKKAFFDDLDTLRIERAEEYPDATAHIPEMVALVETLLEKDHAYRADDGSIYYRITSFPRYGGLSHMNLAELKAGARVNADEYEKDQVSDFALWKAWDADDGNVYWETALGKGRPGWHIECSAMSMKYLGTTFDIHTGGVDNIFPHHENEIAQSEAATGEPFARFWLHCEHLIVDGRKMSKSLGNFHTLQDLIEQGHAPVAIRYLLLATHYRQQLNFTMAGLDAAKGAIERLRDCDQRLSEIEGDGGDADAEFDTVVAGAREAFGEQLDNDLNISGALGVLFEFVREANIRMKGGALVPVAAREGRSFLADADRLLDVLRPDAPAVDAAKIEALIAERAEARASKNWKRADEIRDEFERMGVILEDTPAGTRWKQKV